MDNKQMRIMWQLEAILKIKALRLTVEEVLRFGTAPLYTVDVVSNYRISASVSHKRQIVANHFTDSHATSAFCA